MKTLTSLFISILGINLVSAQGFMCGGFEGAGGGWMIFMWITGFLITVLIIIALVLFIIWLIQQLKTKNRTRR